MGRRVPATSLALDQALFEPTGWFAIDAANARVAGVVVPTLEAGLALLGRGRVASIVGRLRSGIAVVDVDVDDTDGCAITEAIASWCAQQNAWSLVRPSGGSDGRHHVFVALDPQDERLRACIQVLREVHSVAARSIDLRTVVRPLSAPHRAGADPRPFGDLREALRTLPHVTSASRTQARTAAASRTPLRSRTRRRTDLPTEWADYLRTGVRPKIGGHDHTVKPWGSTWEAIATGWLVRCGHDAASAWHVITQSHPNAMGKAKARGRNWWIQCVWNPAVRDDSAFEPEHRVDSVVATAVDDGRCVLDDLQWRFPARRRPALLLVGHHILDRIERTNSLRVPVAERDLVLDTGISDRTTIRQVLRDLNGHLGTLDTTTFDTAHRDSTSFEFEVDAPQRVREIPPPSLHTPLPHGTWGLLPRTSHQLWRHLRRSGEGKTTAQLCVEAGIVAARTDIPTLSQIRTTRAALTQLGRAGLAWCDEVGRWEVRGRLRKDVELEASRLFAETSDRIESERAAYRAGTHSRWSIERVAALKRSRAREHAWWDGLDPAERGERRRALAGRFRRLSVDEQEQMKAELAERRRRAGVDEVTRHDHWVNAWSPATLARRSSERASWFASIAPPLQQAYVAAWRRHRERYAIGQVTGPVAATREATMVLGEPSARRDEAFLEQQAVLPFSDTVILTG